MLSKSLTLERNISGLLDVKMRRHGHISCYTKRFVLTEMADSLLTDAQTERKRIEGKRRKKET
jgi:hypothetical protein